MVITVVQVLVALCSDQRSNENNMQVHTFLASVSRMPPYLAETASSISGTAETGPEQSLQRKRANIMGSRLLLIVLSNINVSMYLTGFLSHFSVLPLMMTAT